MSSAGEIGARVRTVRRLRTRIRRILAGATTARRWSCVVTASPLTEVAAIRNSASLDELLPDDLILAEIASPNRRMAIAQAVEKLGAPAGSVLLVDDTEQNIAIGVGMGMATARIDSNPDTCETAADYCLRSVVDVRDVFAR